MSVDASQLAELFNQYSAALEHYARQWTMSAADCVQEAFIQLARQPRIPENAEAWLYRVVRNGALNMARADARRLSHERAAAAHVNEQRAESATIATTTPIEIDQALAHLASNLREIVTLRVWSELTWREIAQLTGTSSSSAQRRYIQALERLRQQLEKTCETKSN